MLKPNLNFLLFSSTGLGFVISALLLLVCAQMQAGAGTKMASVSQISCWYLVPGTRNLVSKCQAPAIFRSAAWHVMGSWVPSALWHLGLGNVQEVFRERYQIISTIHDKFSNDRDCIYRESWFQITIRPRFSRPIQEHKLPEAIMVSNAL